MPTQGVALPLIRPGGGGVAPGATASVLAGELPQPLTAATVMLPAAALVVAVIAVVEEEPLQPPGSVQE